MKDSDCGLASNGKTLQEQIEEAILADKSPSFYQAPDKKDVGVIEKCKGIINEEKISSEELTSEVVSAGKKFERYHETFNQLDMIPEAYTESMSPQKIDKESA